jgi:ubiquinone/menaquinone biosynthesis C-methylase UbiE
MQERHFHGDPARLRAPDRIARLEVERVVDMSLDGGVVRNVLDVGTGSAVFAEGFAKRGLEVAGVDDAAEMLDLARAYVPQGDFRQGRAEKLPFQDASFDLVFLGHVLHETEPLSALREARRVARGRVVILEWPYREEEHGPPLEHRLESATIARLAREAGFKSTEERSLQGGVLFLLSLR